MGSYYNQNKRDRYQDLLTQMKSERSSFDSQWRDIGDYLLPMRAWFSLSDVNKGDRKNTKIYQNSATLAARTLGSGMLSGTSSPSRPWFRLTVDDPELAEYWRVKDYLYQCTQRMITTFLKSNFYNISPQIYRDMGGFGTGVTLMEEEFSSAVVRYTPYPIGSYYLANDDRLKVGVVAREFRLTVRQIVSKFGVQPNGEIKWDNISATVKNLWDKGTYEEWVDVTHIVQPNEEYSPKNLNAKFKQFSSCYYESGSNQKLFLRESGYDYFPALCPRWETNAEDVYGTYCPGMEAIGDIKQLQLTQKRMMTAFGKIVSPPLQEPVEFRNKQLFDQPGGRNSVSDTNNGIKPIYLINPDLAAMNAVKQDIVQSIDAAFYKALFSKLLDDERLQPRTAREVDEIVREKAGELAPVLEQLNQGYFEPNIDFVYNVMNNRRMLPPAPPELKGMELKVEYISIMHEAQKILGISNIERFTAYGLQLAQIDPNVMDKLDTDKMMEHYGDMTSVPPDILRSEEMVLGIRQQRVAAQQQQQAMAQMQQAGQTAKDLSQADMSGDNALSRLDESLPAASASIAA